MKILNIYENVPLSKINENYSLVWCSRVKNKNNFFLSIYDIIDSNSKYLKKALNDYLKKFFCINNVCSHNLQVLLKTSALGVNVITALRALGRGQ